MTQTTFLTENDQVVVAYPGEYRMRDNFERFHRDNPHVYDALVEITRSWAQATGGRQCGISMVFETARYHHAIRTVGEPFALNNNYRAFYARMIMDREPDLDGIFEVRRQRA